MSVADSTKTEPVQRSDMQRIDGQPQRGVQLVNAADSSTNRTESILDVSAVHDVTVRISVVLGTTELPVRQLLKLGRGAVLELNRKVGDQVDVLVNDRLVARGEIVSLGDRLGVTMTELCRSDVTT